MSVTFNAVTQVPSVPTSARATLNPRSGSSSSRLYPDTRLGTSSDRPEAFTDQRRVAIPEIPELTVDLALAPAGTNHLVEVLFLIDADGEARAVVGDHVHGVNVVGGPRPRPVELRLHRVDAARVVADVPADRAIAVGRGIRAEDQTHLTGPVVDLLVDGSRLDRHQAALRVWFADPPQIFAVVDDHGDVHRFAGQAGAAAPVQDRRAVAAAQAMGDHHVVDGLRYHDAERNLPIVG